MIHELESNHNVVLQNGIYCVLRDKFVVFFSRRCWKGWNKAQKGCNYIWLILQDYDQPVFGISTIRLPSTLFYHDNYEYRWLWQLYIQWNLTIKTTYGITWNGLNVEVVSILNHYFSKANISLAKMGVFQYLKTHSWIKMIR